MPVAVVSAASLLLAGCGGSPRMASASAGGQAYKVFSAAEPAEQRLPHIIAYGDILSVEVFQEADFSRANLPVDNVGNIQLPFIGKVTAAGQTTDELASVITDRLRTRYIVNPQVVVSLVKQAPRYVTVEGDIKEPGVYEIDENSTLISAIARAKSPNKTAKLNEILVFRNTDGQRMAARFNLKDIRSGRAPDPVLRGGDVVIVATSGVKSAYQDLLQALPLLNLFYLLRN